jgi:hypothetical protein
MKKIVERRTKHHQKVLLFHSVHLLVLSSGSKMLSWPNSPLLVMLQLLGPDVLSGAEDEPLQEDEIRGTPLHVLVRLASPSDYFTHENQLILAKQLIEDGANVNAVSSPSGETPLHTACHWTNVTNLDFVELLLKEGANPNSQDHVGLIPLIMAITGAPGAAKFLLNWPTTDVNIIARSGASFLAKVRMAIATYSRQIAFPDNLDQIQHQFLLQQWRDIEEMLVERDAHLTGIAAL